MERPSSFSEQGAAIFTGILFLGIAALLLVADAVQRHLIDGIEGLALAIDVVGAFFLGVAFLPKQR